MRKIICGILLTGLVFSAAAADRVVPMLAGVTATVYVQNATTVLGDVQTVLPPVKYSVTSKSLLAMLAMQEHAAGNYAFTNFIAGATLNYLDDIDDSSQSRFVVMFAGGVLCEVSDILTLAGDDSVEFVNSGKIVPANNFFATKYAQVKPCRVVYDDTGTGGSTRFYLAGIVTGVTTDTLLTGGLFYTESLTAKISGAAGGGIYNGQNCYVIGGLSAAGAATFAK